MNKFCTWDDLDVIQSERKRFADRNRENTIIPPPLDNNNSIQDIYFYTQDKRPSSFIKIPTILPCIDFENKNQIRPLKYLGVGSTCVCVSCSLVSVNNLQIIRNFACKIISKKSLNNHIEREKTICRMIEDHPNLLKTFYFLEDELNHYLISELCYPYHLREQLAQRIDKTIGFHEEIIKRCMLQLLKALAHLHSKRIIHRDVKLENIFSEVDIFQFDHNNIPDHFIKLGDLGGSIKLPSDLDFDCHVFCTPNYMSPEMLNIQKFINNYKLANKNDSPSRKLLFEHKLYYSYPVDIWSAGVLMYTLFSTVPPFQGGDLQALHLSLENYQQIQFPQVFKTSKINNYMSIEARNMISKMMTRDPFKRPSANELLKMPYFKNI
jgi:cell cycle serine/threonine-protein kinase CDC5/MSD2